MLDKSYYKCREKEVETHCFSDESFTVCAIALHYQQLDGVPKGRNTFNSKSKERFSRTVVKKSE